jgi:hypothetical protein
MYHRPTFFWFKDAATVREHIHAPKRHSRFPVWEVNTDFGFPDGLEDVKFGAILLHYSLFGSGVYLLDERFRDYLRRSGALKVAFFQDEFYFCQKRFAFVNEFGIDRVYTHVDPRNIPDVWGRYAPGTRAIFNLPGYVDDGLVAAAAKFARPDAERDLDVGYRGRPLPLHMGAGSQEKRVIGERFRDLAAPTDLDVDIETSEESRIYGDDWYRFLGRCRATLGVESGVSFIDLEDECHAEYVERKRELGREPTLEELQSGALGRWDGRIPYRTMGPRHFEAAAFRILQVLYDGDYNGVMKPMVHYVPLYKDFSNFDEVVRTIRDPEVRRRITDRAHEDLIASGAYTYERFVAGVDAELLDAGLDPVVPDEQRDAVTRSVRQHAARRRIMAELHRLTGAWRYLVGRVAAPVTLRLRRRLGLPIPTD